VISCKLLLPPRTAEGEVAAGSIAGRVNIPTESGLTPGSIAITAGVNGTIPVDSDWSYSGTIDPRAPVLAVVSSPNESPMLLNIFDSTARKNDLDTDTTAATLVFISLGLFTESSAEWKTLLEVVSNVPEVQALASLLTHKLGSNPDVLSADPPDQDIASGLDAAMAAAMAALQSSGKLSAHGLARSPVSRSVSVQPESQCGLSIAVNSNHQAVATNTMLRYVSVTVDGPGVNGIRTLVGSCSPPVLGLRPKDTVLNPDPLPAPSVGLVAAYTIRARGGLDNSNGLYDPDVDGTSLLEAWEISAVANFAMPLISMVLGTSLQSLTAPGLVDSIRGLLAVPLVTFGQDLLDQSLNRDVQLGRLVTGLLRGSFDQWIKNWPYWTAVFVTYLGAEAAEITFANVVPGLNVALRILSLAVNGSQLVVGSYAWLSTDMVDVYTVTIGSDEFTVTYDPNGASAGSAPIDSNLYHADDPVTVHGNSGGLVKTGYSFAGWNTQADGNGTTYRQAQTFAMRSTNVTLYAKWVALSTLLEAPSGGSSYYGMYTTGSYAASFVLVDSYYVSTISVVLHTPSNTAVNHFNFSVQDALTGPFTTYGSATLTTPLGSVSTQVIDINRVLPAGTFYVVGFVPGYYGTPATPGYVNGWMLSTGAYTGAAGTVTNGSWFSAGSGWGFRSDLAAPAFRVEGSAL
jgi:uncharacterized repeat protein (TIGR02543 family)